MKKMFFPTYASSPHLETELELMEQAIDMGDEVFVIMCGGKLKTCFFNLSHKKNQCMFCQSRINQGLKLLKKPLMKDHKIYLSKSRLRYDIIPKVFSSINELYKYKIDNIPVGLAASTDLIFHFEHDHNLNTALYQNEVKKSIISIYYLYHEVIKIFQRVKPDCVYFFNGRFGMSRAIYLACKTLGIEFYTHERAGSLNKYLLRKNLLPQENKFMFQELLSLWKNADPIKKVQYAESWFQERRKGIDQGWASFIKDQNISQLPENFDKKKKNIVIYNSTIEEYCTLQEFLEPGIYKDELDGLERIVSDCLKKPEIHIYIRVHPNLRGKKNTQNRFLKQLGKKYKNVSIILPESSIHSYTLLDNAEKIIVFGSTVGVEGCFWGKPVILTTDARYRELDVAYLPKTHKDLMILLNCDLCPKPRENALPYGFWEKEHGILFKYYKQIRIDHGTFKGHFIELDFHQKFLITCVRLLELKNLESYKKEIIYYFHKFHNLILSFFKRSS